ARAIVPGRTYSGSTAGASLDGGSACSTQGQTSDVWYKYQPGIEGDAVAAITTADFYYVISVYSGCPGSVSNELACAPNNGTGAAALAFHAKPGVVYRLRLSGQYNFGNFSLVLTGPPVAGSDCNANGIPDACDITNGISIDCNANGIPDSCEVTAQAYS